MTTTVSGCNVPLGMADTLKVEVKKNNDETHNRELIDRALAGLGKVKVRVSFQVEDPTSKQFTGLRGESFTFTAPTAEAVSHALNAIVAALQRMK